MKWVKNDLGCAGDSILEKAGLKEQEKPSENSDAPQPERGALENPRSRSTADFIALNGFVA